MNLFLLFLILYVADAQAGFGKAYLGNSLLCREWSCINKRQGLLDVLPPKHAFGVYLRVMLPKGVWHETIGDVLDACYDSRPRIYTNTCPGQALFHCVVDQLIENCPEENLKKEDVCSPIQSLAGTDYMFSQRKYKNFTQNLPIGQQPSWFMNSYFNKKCCDIPTIISDAVLSDCGFTSIINYNVEPQHAPSQISSNINQTTAVPITSNTFSKQSDGLKIVSLKDVIDQVPTTTPAKIVGIQQPAQTSHLKEEGNCDVNLTDPLDCCDMTEFIRPSWRWECDFKVKWDEQKRISIENITHMTTTEQTTTTTKTTKIRDLMLVPYSCEKENCVFQTLGIVSEAGSVDMNAFVKLLDKLTDSQPWWTKAKARVVTTCLNKPLTEYEADCDINKILSCTFDVLSENCPFKTKKDVCKHTRNNAVCQVSSSKYRPRKRRDICHLPQLVDRSLLTQCNLTTLNYAKEAPEILTANKFKKHSLFSSRYLCLDQTQTTTCLMGKMGVLNKYNFMDHFKMKDRIRQFTSSDPEWAALVELLMSAFTNIPMYREYCSSPKKLLNVIDTMLMTCPISRRKNTPQCKKIFSDMINASPLIQQNFTQQKLDDVLKHFHQVFMPTIQIRPNLIISRPKSVRKIVKKPIYNYGLLSSKNVPRVRIINVQQRPTKPLVLLPVYMRVPHNTNVILKPHLNDGVLRSTPFWLHTQIAMAHANVLKPANTSTPVSINSPVVTYSPASTITVKPEDIAIPDTFEDFQKISL